MIDTTPTAQLDQSDNRSGGDFSRTNARPERFLRIWAVAFGLLIACFCLLAAVVDPYLLFDIPRLEGFNALKPAADTQQRLMKAYDVLRLKPRTLVLGSSRAALGLDALDSAWPGESRPVYNLGFAAGGPYVAYRYLQHVSARNPPSMIVLGLEFEHFLDYPDPLGAEFESHLLVKSDGRVTANARQYLQDLFQNTFSLDALSDSIATVFANLYGGATDLRQGNWYSSGFPSLASEVGSYPVVVVDDVANFLWYPGRRRDPAAMRSLAAILKLCQAARIGVILFISPSHADVLETLQLSGQWQAFESWKRELVRLIATYREAGGDSVTLWDFSDYDAYSTESVSRKFQVLRWFKEPYHYNHALGQLMIRRFCGGSNIDFGTALTPDNIESHLARIRARQSSYRATQPADAQRVSALYQLIKGPRSRGFPGADAEPIHRR